MLIILHVIFALASLAVALVNFFKPASTLLKTSYGLAISTLASGILLIVINNASVLRTCMTGVIFFAVITVLNEFARKRLVSDTLDI